MTITNAEKRRAALAAYVDRLSPNLLRAYVLDNLIADAGEAEVDKLVVALHAGGHVPAKDAG